eukprot:519397-Prorocentrum_minimum.AAC.2
MAAGFPRNSSCPSGRPDHPPTHRGGAVDLAHVLVHEHHVVALALRDAQLDEVLAVLADGHV